MNILTDPFIPLCGNCTLYMKKSCPRETAAIKKAKRWNTINSPICGDYSEDTAKRKAHEARTKRAAKAVRKCRENDREILNSLIRLI